jgi:Small-conductance mechanosensitive channel
MLKHIKWRKMIPLVILVGLAVLAGGTDVFSAAIQTQVIEVMKKYLEELIPFAASIFVGMVFMCLAYVLYDPLKAGMEKALNLSHADNRRKMLISRGAILVYWIVSIFVGTSFISADFLSKLVVGVGLVGAALTLALQGIANDFIAGILLNFSPKCCVGDEIELVGLAVKGKVTDIGYVQTVVETPTERFEVPNREVWSRAVKVTAGPNVCPTPPTEGSTDGSASGSQTASRSATRTDAVVKPPASGGSVKGEDVYKSG